MIPASGLSKLECVECLIGKQNKPILFKVTESRCGRPLTGFSSLAFCHWLSDTLIMIPALSVSHSVECLVGKQNKPLSLSHGSCLPVLPFAATSPHFQHPLALVTCLLPSSRPIPYRPRASESPAECPPGPHWQDFKPELNRVFITAVPITKLFAWGEGDSGGHVLRETTRTSQGLSGLVRVCPLASP
jgi:hypothetical protein